MYLHLIVGIIREQSPLKIDLYTLEASELNLISVSHIATIQASYYNTAPDCLVSNNIEEVTIGYCIEYGRAWG